MISFYGNLENFIESSFEILLLLLTTFIEHHSLLSSRLTALTSPILFTVQIFTEERKYSTEYTLCIQNEKINTSKGRYTIRQ